MKKHISVLAMLLVFILSVQGQNVRIKGKSNQVIVNGKVYSSDENGNVTVSEPNATMTVVKSDIHVGGNANVFIGNGVIVQKTDDYIAITIGDTNYRLVRVEGGTCTVHDKAADCSIKTRQTDVSEFFLGETEVTQQLWKAVMGSNPAFFNRSEMFPVEQVSWDDCQEFINRLNCQTGLRFRLPTEAEWLFAARGGTQSRGYKFSGSNLADAVAWCERSSTQNEDEETDTHFGPQPVKMKQPNELGLYDMSGNVSEWCQDQGRIPADYTSPPSDVNQEDIHVLLGGSWCDEAQWCRVDQEYVAWVNWHGNHLIGLRLACEK